MSYRDITALRRPETRNSAFRVSVEKHAVTIRPGSDLCARAGWGEGAKLGCLIGEGEDVGRARLVSDPNGWRLRQDGSKGRLYIKLPRSFGNKITFPDLPELSASVETRVRVVGEGTVEFDLPWCTPRTAAIAASGALVKYGETVSVDWDAVETFKTELSDRGALCRVILDMLEIFEWAVEEHEADPHEKSAKQVVTDTISSIDPEPAAVVVAAIPGPGDGPLEGAVETHGTSVTGPGGGPAASPTEPAPKAGNSKPAAVEPRAARKCVACGAALPEQSWRGVAYCSQSCLDRHAADIEAQSVAVPTMSITNNPATWPHGVREKFVAAVAAGATKKECAAICSRPLGSVADIIKWYLADDVARAQKDQRSAERETLAAKKTTLAPGPNLEPTTIPAPLPVVSLIKKDTPLPALVTEPRAFPIQDRSLADVPHPMSAWVLKQIREKAQETLLAAGYQLKKSDDDTAILVDGKPLTPVEVFALANLSLADGGLDLIVLEPEPN